MKAFRNFSLLKIVVVTTVFLLIAWANTPPSLAGPRDKEKFVVATNATTTTFPAKPDGVTETLTVSSPTIVIDDSVCGKLGGPALAKMARPSLENLLNNSGRFTVMLEGDAPYKITATVTSLKVSQLQGKKGANASELLKHIVPKLTKDNKIDSELMSADWTKDEMVMKVECGLTVQIMDKSGRLVAGNPGSVTRENKTSTIRADLGGITIDNGSDRRSDGSVDAAKSDVDVPTRLIELAAYDSLIKSIAAIDNEIAHPKTTKTTALTTPDAAVESGSNDKPIASGASGAPPSNFTASASKSKFCSQCGQKVDADDKFCPSCGKAVRK